jgi:hypothetical protein
VTKSTYEIALTRIAPDQREVIEKQLNEWSTATRVGRFVLDNITRERFLSAESMSDLLMVFWRFGARPGGFSLQEEYQKKCCEHVGEGGIAVPSPRPYYVGRAVEREYFAKWLVRAHGRYFRSERNARDFIRRLLLGDGLSPREQQLTMSTYSAWVTWDHKGQRLPPFSFVRYDRAEEVRASLGLDAEQRFKGRWLLLLEYELRPDLVLHRPTVADAGLSEFFSPPPPGSDAHGWTKPWPRGLCRIIDHEPEPKPEAIHAPERLQYLKTPLRQLR